MGQAWGRRGAGVGQSSPRLDGEGVGLVGGAAGDAGPVNPHAGRVAALGDGDAEGAVGHRAAVVRNVHRVNACGGGAMASS